MTTAELLPPLIEAVGGEVLGERVLDEMLQRRLDAAGIEIDDARVNAERELIARNLAEDPDDAARLLAELRQRRGLGEVRFRGLLRRNAGLRALVADQITVTEPAIRREFRLRHGPASRVRLITTDTLGDAQRLRRQALAGDTPFGELAALHSTDPSAAQGGLLSPIRPDDTSYPEVLRSALENLEPGGVSPPLALDGGFALLKLEEKIAGAAVEFDDVKDGLADAVRRRAERVLMQQLARELVSAADVVVLDPALKSRWEAQRKALLRSP